MLQHKIVEAVIGVIGDMRAAERAGQSFFRDADQNGVLKHPGVALQLWRGVRVPQFELEEDRAVPLHGQKIDPAPVGQ